MLLFHRFARRRIEMENADSRADLMTQGVQGLRNKTELWEGRQCGSRQGLRREHKAS